METRIIVADDHSIVREGLEALIRKQEGFEFTACARNGKEAVSLASMHNPDVMIMDIGMPDMNGIDATLKIRKKVPEVRVIAMSMHSDKHSVSGMLQAGARGFLIKECAFEELMDAIKAVMEGHFYLSRVICDVLVDSYLELLEEKQEVTSILTLREREVIQMIAEGLSIKEIAFALEISAKTVDTYYRRIREKLGVATKADLIRYAIREQLTDKVG